MQTIDQVAVTGDEMDEMAAWLGAAFQGLAPNRPPPEPYLLALVNKWGPIHRNRHVRGQPLNIAGVTYASGLYCHAVSRVAVRLFQPARLLSAVVGVDSNPETQPGRGNVVFAVKAGARELFRSPILREGMDGVPVHVDLGGVQDFVLEADEGGLGDAYCQADWADARVTLADGRELRLGDLALPSEPPKGPHAIAWPFSFVYGGRPSAELLARWPLRRGERELDGSRTEHTLVWTDPDTQLQVRCVAVQYHDFPTVEWTVYLKNGGGADTPIIEHLRAIDARFEREPGCEFLLHHAIGSPCIPGDYGPLRAPLGKTASKRITTNGGRGSNSDWPYFNLEAGSEGTIIVVGWPGQWAADFVRDGGSGIRVSAGQETTHFTLHPGEEARTPLMAVQFWKGGDWIRAQNIWRRWMVAHNMPRPGGKLPAPMQLGYTGRFHDEMAKANEENQFACFNRYLAEGLKLDYWWIDAGWYPIKGSWVTTGTWEVDRTRFPRGLKSISNLAHRHGAKLLVWFEPERVTPDTWLANNHPEWLLGGTLLDLGNPDAWKWLVNHVDRLLTDEGIDLYRQDFNMDPLPFWQTNDAPDRQGLTENKHVCGHLAYWDELRRRHPNMLIDSCASGGRRNDLESMRRAVPLWRSDCIMNSLANQSQTYGISLWLPYYGAGTVAADGIPVHAGGWTPVVPYAFWSDSTPSTVFMADIREQGLDYPLLRKLFAQWRQVSPCYYGDFYPLTPYTLDNDLWIGWQFHRADTEAGMVQCFRREQSPYESARFKLRALEPDVRYEVRNLGEETAAAMTGAELMEQGLPVTLRQQPAAGVFVYCRVPMRV